MKAERALARGHSVALYPFDVGHITDQYLGWLNDPDVVLYSNQRFRRHDWQSAKAYYETFIGTDNLFLSLRECSTNRAVGTMTAYVACQHGTADIGIMIGDRNCWGRGYGLEAWVVLMRYLFRDLGLRKVTGGTLRCNVAMIRIMQRAGMQPDGVRVAEEIVDGFPQDVLHFASFSA